MSNPSFDDILSTTTKAYSPSIADNVTNNNALLRYVNKSGNVKEVEVDGGQSILQNIDFAQNGSSLWYSGYQRLDVSNNQTLTSAEFGIRQAAVAVTFSGLEKAQNMGRAKMHDLIKARLKNANSSIQNTIATSTYSDGSDPLVIGGLRLLVANNPTTGTVGGINRATATNAYWRNIAYSGATDGGAAVSAANIQTYMSQVFNRTTRGTDKVNVILADNNYYTLYENSLQGIQRIMSANTGEAGFETLKFKGADVVLDGGRGGACPANTMYFLNTDYIHFRPIKGFNFTPLEPRTAIDQDATVQFIVFYGNMTLSCAFTQGVLIA